MDFLTPIASFGFVPGLFITGRLALINIIGEESRSLGKLGQLAIEAVAGILIWLAILYTLASLQLFDPVWIGAVGWALTIGYLVLWIRMWRHRSESIQWQGGEKALIAIALGLFVWNGFYSAESMEGGRDQGTYFLHGVGIAKSSSVRVKLPYEGLVEREYGSIRHIANPRGFGYNLQDRSMEGQFPPAFPLMLAQFYGISGYEGLILLVPFLASLNLLLAYVLARQYLGFHWALWAALFFALNPAQLWNARITLSEILAQSLILGGILLATVAIETQRRRVYLTGILLLVSSCFVRIDGYLFFFIASVSALALQLFANGNRLATYRRTHASVFALLGLLFGLAYLYYTNANHFYFWDFWDDIKVIGYASLAVLAISVLFHSSTVRDRFQKLFPGKIVWAGIAAGLALALVYCIFVRPHIEPYSQFEDPHYGTRDYRENSVNDLAAYISHVAIALGLLGSLIALRHLMTGGKGQLALLLLPWLAFSLIYLYDPQISADHIWRIRRFTPIVIPGFILFAALGLQFLETKYLARFNRPFHRYAIWLATAGFIGYSIAPLATLRQYEGFFAMARELGNQIEDEAFVISDISTHVLGTFAIAEGKSIARVDFSNPHMSQLAKGIAEKESAAGRPVYLLSRAPMTSIDSGLLKEAYPFTYTVLHSTNTPPARKRAERHFSLFLSRIDGPIRSFTGSESSITIGGNPLFDVRETGIHGVDSNWKNPSRWTGERATLELPLIFDHSFTRGNIKLVATGRNGSRMTLKANGKTLVEATVPRDGSMHEFVLDGVVKEGDESILFELECETWVPAEENPKHSDHRRLGVRLAGITLTR